MFHVLSTLRHRCQPCGGCCQTTRITLGMDEISSTERTGAALGVPNAVDGRHLRMHEGQCVFLDAQGLCSIHARLGAHRKPLVCRQYPLILCRTEEDELRAGIDPGCYCYIQHWTHGPPLSPRSGAVERKVLEPAALEQEEHLLDLLLEEGMDVAGLARALTGDPGVGFPPELTTRIATLLDNSGFIQLLARADIGPVMAAGMQPLVEYFSQPPSAPSASTALPAESDAYTLESIRQLCWLRLCAHLANPPAVAWAMLVGAVALTWCDLSPERFGASLAAWSRAIRSPPFWKVIFPSPDTVLWLAHGDPQRPDQAPNPAPGQSS